MDRILARLERRFGRFAIGNLTTFIVFGMAIVFMMSMARPDVVERLALDMSAVRRGEVWRLVTYLFIPRSLSFFWILFTLGWVWMLGHGLESEWGAFKFNVYYLLGMLGTTFAAVVTGQALGNYYLNLTLVFAFATIAPDYEVLLLILPVKMKWLAWLSVALHFSHGQTRMSAPSSSRAPQRAHVRTAADGGGRDEARCTAWARRRSFPRTTAASSGAKNRR
jgi:hypothetical protein